MLRNKLLGLIILSVVVSAGCRYDMEDQPRYRVYKPTTWFADGRSSRELPEGTVARGYLRENRALYTGKLDVSAGTAQTNEAGQPVTFPDAVTEFPVPVTKETLDIGQTQYNVNCALCHGAFGNGDGMIVRRGFPKPPNFNDDRLRNAPVGHFFDVASNGWGKMSGYAAQVSVSNRWAIVAYIRTLQLSQNPTGTAPAALPANTAKPATAKPAEQPANKPAEAPKANTNANQAGGNK